MAGSRDGSASKEKPCKRKPNIVFIMADDLGYGELSATGQKYYKTPNIDSLAQNGIRYNQFYSGSTVCAPSRCSLMTGLTTGHAWVRANEPEAKCCWPTAKPYLGKLVPLRTTEVTIPRVLKALGYSTGMFGKWGLGDLGTTGEPLRQGFDEYFGYLDQVHAHLYYTDHLVENGKQIPWDKTKYTHDAIWQKGMDFVRNHKDEPFFLYLPVTIPHASMSVPDDSKAPFLGKFQEKPYKGDGFHPAQEHPAAAFAGMVTRLDRDVGRLLDLLKELGLDEDTIVFFTSDNGPHNDCGHDHIFFESSGGYRGRKCDMYEGGIHVPMFVRWLGKIKAGSTSEELFAFWDMLPTMAELAGLPQDALPECDGVSMAASLKGHPSARNKERTLYWEFYGYGNGFKQAVRMGKWKGVRVEVSNPLQVFNLKEDPAETTNLAKERPDIVKKLERAMSAARTESPIWKSGFITK